MSADSRAVMTEVADALDRVSHLPRPATTRELVEWARALRLAIRADELADQRASDHRADARLWRDPTAAS